jgi:hypothetical protein
MREIKFRGKDDALIWHYGDLVTMTVGRPLIIDSVIVDNDIGEPITVAPATIGQFTGLLDSAGKEIYEGDILSIQGAFGANATVVKWHDGMWCVKKDLPLCHTIAIASVIGNVHDNPSLLESNA